MGSRGNEKRINKKVYPCTRGYPRGWPWKSGFAEAVISSAKRGILPTITVVTPSFNQGRFLEAAILSVLRQNYPSIEYIVLDGGSTDGSIDIIKKYENGISYWRSRKDKGQADALATGFDMATGSIYCWLNSDDILLPNALMYVAAAFLKHDGVNFVYGNRLVIDETGGITGQHRWPYYLTKYHWHDGQPLAQECCFWRNTLYEKVGGIDRGKFFIMDYDLFYRMWQVGKFRKSRRFLGCFRRHAESKNAIHQSVRQEEIDAARREFGLVPPGYVTARILNRFDRFQLFLDASLQN
jgi:glycosyltransferase involved in cell wall biosynthesis